MIVIGLTGSIGMGKSTTADLFAARGVPAYAADAAVHRLYAGAAVGPIEAAFPGTTAAGAVDRAKLWAAVEGRPEAMARLEAIVHPLVRAEERAFVAAAAVANRAAVVLDIPLLFETRAEPRLDLVAVVSAPAAVQRARVLARPGMTEAKFDLILARQMSDREKRRRAHVVIDTGGTHAATGRQVDAILRLVAQMVGKPTRRA